MLAMMQAARAGNGAMTETLVWKQPGRDIVVSYSRDRDGDSGLRFREYQSRHNLPITFLVDSDKDLLANLSLAGMQDFNGMLVVSLETATGYVVLAFLYDDRLDVVTEVATASGRWLPELLYYGDQADPAFGILRQQTGSKGRQAALICGEKIYVLDPRARRIQEVNSRWTPRGRTDGITLDANCTD